MKKKEITNDDLLKSTYSDVVAPLGQLVKDHQYLGGPSTVEATLEQLAEVKGFAILPKLKNKLVTVRYSNGLIRMSNTEKYGIEGMIGRPRFVSKSAFKRRQKETIKTQNRALILSKHLFPKMIDGNIELITRHVKSQKVTACGTQYLDIYRGSKLKYELRGKLIETTDADYDTMYQRVKL